MAKKSTKNIRTAFALNLSFSAIELAGGLLTKSTAITTDALHDFCDCVAIAVSWFLEKKAERQPDRVYTYGYGRFSVLGALISSAVLVVSSLVAVFMSVPRIMHPAEIHYDGVLALAVLGFAVNSIAAYKTAKGRSLNEKAISLHLLEDVLGWAAVLATGIVMKAWDFPILDPILSILIAVFMLVNAAGNVKKIFDVFLERAPQGINIEQLKAHIRENDSIKDIHHVHIWTLDGTANFITLHALISDAGELAVIKRHIKEELSAHGIAHSTIEFEFGNDTCDSPECQIDAEGHSGHFGHSH